MPAATKAATRARDRRPVGAGAHQVLADERRVEAERPPAAQQRRVADARLRDDEPVVRDVPPEPLGGRGVHDERPQVAVVDADEPRVGGERGIELAGVVDLDERLEPKVEGPRTSRASAACRCRAASSSTASAPAARSSGSCRGSTTNSLASTGTVTAARAVTRSSIEPPNQCGSTSTEIDRRATRVVGACPVSDIERGVDERPGGR